LVFILSYLVFYNIIEMATIGQQINSMVSQVSSSLQPQYYQPQVVYQTGYQQPQYFMQPQQTQTTTRTSVNIVQVQPQQSPSSPNAVFQNNRASTFDPRADLEEKLRKIELTADSLYSSILADRDHYVKGSHQMKDMKRSLSEINIAIDKIVTDINLSHKKAMIEVEFQGKLVKSFGSVNKLMDLLWKTKRYWKTHIGSGTAKKICHEIESKSSQVTANMKVNVNIDSSASVGGTTGIQLNLDDREDLTKISQLPNQQYVVSSDIERRM